MLWFIIASMFLTNLCNAILQDSEREDDRCESIIKEIILEDRAAVADESSARLHSTWLSQECEVRAGPEYVIRKYKFFENGTFLLLRHHYAEESCSVATHTVVARGSIEILSASRLVLGATEAKIQLETVHIVPLNRQVAHKFGRKVNSSCGPQAKWRPYTVQMVYEHLGYPSNTFFVHGPNYNSLQNYWPLRKRRSIDCLDVLGIEFTELRLLRVQKKRYPFSAFGLRERSFVTRVELLLGGLPRSPQYRRYHRPTSLQATPLLRADMAAGCPICGSVARGTEFSPPLLHVIAPLPALIGGLWLSTACESTEGGFWSKRLFHVYSGEKLWTGRWDYYADSQCSIFLYASIAAGNYLHRADRRKRIDKFEKYADESASLTKESVEHKKERYSDPNMYRHILRNTEASMARSFEAMLRGNQRTERENNDRAGDRGSPIVPSGTTDLELHVQKSLLIPGNTMISVRCGVKETGMALTSWPRNCVPRALKAPSTLSLKAKLGVNWSGQYTLLLGSRDDNLWEAPLRRCSLATAAPLRNSPLDPHSSPLRYGFFSSVASPFASSANPLPRCFLPILLESALLLFYWFCYTSYEIKL